MVERTDEHRKPITFFASLQPRFSKFGPIKYRVGKYLRKETRVYAYDGSFPFLTGRGEESQSIIITTRVRTFVYIGHNLLRGYGARASETESQRRREPMVFDLATFLQLTSAC